MGLQIFFFLLANIVRKYYPKHYEAFLNKYLFIQKSDLDSKNGRVRHALLDKEVKYALAKAYEHPWWKLESSVKFIAEKK